MKILRIDRGLSRQDLATALGVHYQTVGYLERGEYSPSLALALRIAEYLDLPVEAVFSLTPMAPLMPGTTRAAERPPTSEVESP